MMRASIIIPVHNRCEDLKECLRALPAEVLAAQDTEVIVVDDGSTDDVAEVVSREFPRVRLLKTMGNLGPSHARNLGASAAEGVLFIFLDSDAVPDQAWLPALLAADDGETVLIGEAVDYDSGRVQGGPRRATFLGKSLPCRPDRANTGAACNLAAPMKLFRKVDGFDEEIPYYFEDSFFCIQARLHGASFRYLPGARVRHKGSAVRRGDAIRMQEQNSTYAMLKLYQRSPWRFIAFFYGNGLWFAFRLALWTMTGRFSDARLLALGWVGAYRKFIAR